MGKLRELRALELESLQERKRLENDQLEKQKAFEKMEAQWENQRRASQVRLEQLNKQTAIKLLETQKLADDERRLLDRYEMPSLEQEKPQSKVQIMDSETSTQIIIRHNRDDRLIYYDDLR